MSKFDMIVELMVKNGVTTKFSENLFKNLVDNEPIIELDFSEHDKVFEDKIASLEKQIANMQAEKNVLRTRCMESARDNFDNGIYGRLTIVKSNELEAENKELKQRIAKLEEKNKNLVDMINELQLEKTHIDCDLYNANKRIAELESKETETQSGIDTSTPIDCANSLINHLTHLEAFLIAPERYERTFDTDDLEQIAEHLLVYCKHNKESE